MTIRTLKKELANAGARDRRLLYCAVLNEANWRNSRALVRLLQKYFILEKAISEACTKKEFFLFRTNCIMVQCVARSIITLFPGKGYK